MNLFEISHPEGALDADDHARFAAGINTHLLGGESGSTASAPEETLRRARAMTHVGFRELAGWSTGAGPWQAGSAPPLWVTVTVPEAWREDLAPTLMGIVRRCVRDLDERRGWDRGPGAVWINVVGIPDGSIGLEGRPASADDVVLHMTEEYRAKAATDDRARSGVVVDPICGMQVRLGPEAITLEHDGVTLGFCAKGCRAAYAREFGLVVPAGP